MKNIITKIRNIVLWIVLVLVLIWIVGTALFLLFPKIQRTAIRLVLFYYKVPLYIDYDSAKLTPGYFRFTDIFAVYSSEKDTIMASVDTLELYYSSGEKFSIRPGLLPLAENSRCNDGIVSPNAIHPFRFAASSGRRA